MNEGEWVERYDLPREEKVAELRQGPRVLGEVKLFSISAVSDAPFGPFTVVPKEGE